MRRIVLGMAVGMLALGACGGGDDTELVEATPAGVARAATKTLDDSSGRFTAEMSMEVLGQPISLTYDGAYADGRSEMEMDFGELFGQIPGAEEGLPEGMSLDEPVRMVMDGSTIYMCGSFFTLLTGGTECGSMDLGAAGEIAAGSNDPTAFLRGLVGAGAVEEVGTDEVDGVETTHLRGTYTPRDAIGELDADQAEALRAQFEQLGSDADAVLDMEVPFDVWIDEDGRIRRTAIIMDMAAAGVPGAEVSVEMDMRLFDFGDDITIEVPTDAVDLTDSLGGFAPPD